MIKAIGYLLGAVVVAALGFIAWKMLLLGLTLLGILWAAAKVVLVAAVLWFGINWLYKKVAG